MRSGNDRRWHGIRIALMLLAATLAPSMAAAQADCLSPRVVERALLVQSRFVGYYGSYDLGAYNPNVKRAVIMVHGVGRNAADYYDTLVGSACLAEERGFANEPTKDTILLAPHFRNDTDNPPSEYHRWKGDGWVEGDPSMVGPTLSSYAVIDAIIGELVGMRGPRDHRRRFPNLEMIVVAGHSAGGQFTHRYAATNGRDGSLTGIRMRYVVANPSSYLYPNESRPHYNGSSGVGLPYVWWCGGLFCFWVTNPGFSGAPICPSSYNDWRFGLEGLNPYAAAVGPAAIQDRLISRKVTLLLGALDVDPNAENLDNSCPARLQGPNRWERGHRLFAYLNDQFPVYHGHSVVEVDDAGHSAWDMFVAPPGGAGTGSAVLFYDF